LYPARLGEREQAFKSLEKAFVANSDQMVRLREELAFVPLRSDRRFADLARRIRFP